MNIAIYYLRVFLVSIEAFILAIFLWGYVNYIDELNRLASTIKVDSELSKYLMLIPIALAVWVFIEIRNVILQDVETTKILLEWADYWKLKVHFTITKIYLFVFCIMSLLPWIRKEGISDGLGMTVFVVSIVGQLVVAYGVYEARQRIHEYVAFAR